MSRRIRSALLPLLTFSFVTLLPSAASAHGFELAGAGARELGRGDAAYAATDSPLSIYYNPAALARIDDYRLTGSLAVIWADVCMSRIDIDGSEPSNPTGTPGAELPEVCNQGRPSAIPQVALTLPVSDGFTLGAGVLPPTSPQVQNFGDVEDSGFVDVDGSTIVSPLRYMVLDVNLLQVFINLSAGFEVHERLRFGLGFGWGLTIAEFTTTSFTRLNPPMDPLDPEPGGGDSFTRLEASDAFVPRITGSMQANPTDTIDLGFTFRWTDDVKAGAELEVISVAGLPPAFARPIRGVSLTTPQTFNLNFAFRYHQPLPGGPVDDLGDRMSSDAWDVELDILWGGNKRVDTFEIDVPDDAEVLLSPDATSGVALPDEISLEHRWKHQLGLRLGGEYNVVPGVFAARAGFGYDSDGVQDGYEQIDFLPFQRWTLNVGATVRIGGRLDLSIGYAHIFQEQVTNDPSEARYRRIPSGEAVPADAIVVNAGTIRSSYDILSLESTYTF